MIEIRKESAENLKSIFGIGYKAIVSKIEELEKLLLEANNQKVSLDVFKKDYFGKLHIESVYHLFTEIVENKYFLGEVFVFELTETYKFGFLIQKKNPKPNALSYELETINDMFHMVTEENLERFMKDLHSALHLFILKKQALEATEEGLKVTKENLVVNPFTWIDD